MSQIIFKVAFVALWIIYILIRVLFDKKYKQTEKVKTLDSLTEKFLLIIISLGLLLIPLVWVFTPFLDGFTIELPNWVRWLGVVISVLSLFYFNLIHKTIGANWSPTLEIIKGHQLIQIGVYKRIRHPMYSQMLIWALAQCLIISNYIAGLSGLIVWVVFYFIRVPREEKMMTEYYGDEYLEYIKQTGKILPIKRINKKT